VLSAVSITVSALALLMLGYAVIRGRAEEREAMQLDLRAPPQRVEFADSTRLGVVEAADGGLARRYLSRSVDPSLDMELQHALSSHSQWLLVVRGPSRVGKTRTLYESLSRHSRHRESLAILAPKSVASLLALLDPTKPTPVVKGAVVLWLDALEPFLDSQLGRADLERWIAVAPGRRAVVATFGGKSLTNVPELEQLRSCTREVRLGRTTAEELLPVHKKLSEPELAVAVEHGWAAYLTAAPALAAKMQDQTHPGDAEPSEEGYALVRAAMDWVRCGRTDAAPREVLAELWGNYLPTSTTPTDAALDAGLDWATRPLVGTVRLLQCVPGHRYRIEENTVDLLTKKLELTPPLPEVAWTAALSDAVGQQRTAVAVAALVHGDRWAVLRALEGACEPREIVGRIWAALAIHAMQTADWVDAIKALENVSSLAAGGTSAALRELDGIARFNIGSCLTALGPENDTSAADIYQQIFDEYQQRRDRALRRVALAALDEKARLTVNLSARGAFAEALGRGYAITFDHRPSDDAIAEAVRCLTAVLDDFDTDPSFDSLLRRTVVAGRSLRALLARLRGDVGSAIADYQRVIAGHTSDTDPATRTMVQQCILDLGRLYTYVDVMKGREAEADDIRSKALEIYTRRLLIPQSLSDVEIARTLAESLRLMAASGATLLQTEPLVDRLVREFGDSPNIHIRRDVAVGRVLGGQFLAAAGHDASALRRLKAVIDECGGSDDEKLCHWVGTAQRSVAEILARQQLREDAGIEDIRRGFPTGDER
jgi:hypothetical protein